MQGLNDKEILSILDNTPDAIALVDFETNFLAVNKEYEILTGFSERELLKLSCKKLTHPEDLPFVEENNEILRKTGIVRGFRKRCRNKQGEFIHVEMNLKVYADDRVIVSTRDISQGALANQKIKLFRKMLDHSQDTVFVVRIEDARIIDVTLAGCRKLGYDKEEMLKLSVRDIMPYDLNLTEWSGFVENLQKKQMNKFRDFHKKKDGSLLPVEVVINFSEEDDSSYLVLVARDISEIVESEKKEEMARMEAEESKRIMLFQSRQAAMGEMISMVAHQWRQPLNVLALMFYNLKDAFADTNCINEEAKKLYVSIDEQIKELSGTINDFTHFFKMEKESKPFEVGSVFKKIKKIYSSTFHGKNITLNIVCNEKIYLKGRSGELSQVLANLITNSAEELLEANSASRIITLDARIQNDEALISVSDNGRGIQGENPDYVFDPYYSTKGQNGTGLGLYMSRKIVTQYFNGEMYAMPSEEGAVFVIKIPLAETQG